jgi:VanZ family protein
VLSVRIPDESRLLQELENSGHALLFGGVAVLLLRERKAGLRSYVGAALLTTGLGIATELMQWVEGRDAEIMDVLRDAAGAVAFLGVAWTLLHDVTRGRRFLVLAGASFVLLVDVAPPAMTATALAQRWHRFPVIADFESAIGTRFCSAGNAQLAVVPVPGGHAAQVTFRPAEYSGFAIEGPFPDWTGYRNLVFRATSGQVEDVRLNLRIHDARHNNEYRDRYNVELRIRPGVNEIRIPLDRVEGAPQTRGMDLKAIRAIGVFVVRPARRFDLWFDDFRLE